MLRLHEIKPGEAFDYLGYEYVRLDNTYAKNYVNALVYRLRDGYLGYFDAKSLLVNPKLLRFQSTTGQAKVTDVGEVRGLFHLGNLWLKLPGSHLTTEEDLVFDFKTNQSYTMSDKIVTQVPMVILCV